MLHFTSKEDKMYFMPHVGINFGMGESLFCNNLHLQLPKIKLKERRSMLHQPIA